MLSKDVFGTGCFIVECDVSAAFQHKLYFLLRTGRSDDFQALPLGQLDNEA